MLEYRLPVAVVMQRRVLANRWQEHSWRAMEIVPDTETEATRPVGESAEVSHRRYPGFVIELFRDEAENYYLNLSAVEPCVFVMWRTEGGLAVPKTVTVSYGEAARMMDADEHVDNVPMPDVMRPWVEGFVHKFYRPQSKQRARPPSFRGARRSDP